MDTSEYMTAALGMAQASQASHPLTMPVRRPRRRRVSIRPPLGPKLTHDETHRKLKSRHIQFIGMGGTIGTALYVQIGRGLMQGGPASLFMAFTIW